MSIDDIIVQLRAYDADFQTQLAQADAAVADLQGQIDAQTAALTDARNQLTTVLAENQANLAQITNLNEQVTNLQNQIIALNTSLTQAQATIDQQKATILDLQNQLAAYGPVVSEFSDFTANGGVVGQLLPISTQGKGITKELRRMKVKSSHYTPTTVPLSTANPPTNLLAMWRLDPGGKAGALLTDLILELTEQGHEYHGLTIANAPGALLARLLMKYTGTETDLGSAGSPPHEDFVVNTNHADNLVMQDVVLDGGGRAASVLGVNNQAGFTATGGKFTGAKYGMGATWWNTTGKVLVDGTDISGNYKPLNAENCGGATEIRIRKADLSKKVHEVHMTVQANNGSCPIIFEDVIVDVEPLTVWGRFTAGAQYLGKPATQDWRQIKRFINGIDVSNDPTKLRITGK